jgi:hypothetical protein
MKKQFLLWLVMMPSAFLIAACGNDDNDDNDYDGETVVVNEDGTTSNGSIFSYIDEKNFYLDGVKYSIVDGHLVVSMCDAKKVKSTTVNIVPKISINGTVFKVLSIGEYAFHWCSDLTSVTIPNGVITIEEEAFYGCARLTSITIPRSVASIGKLAFWYCHNLTSISVEDGNKVYDSRNNCNAIIETKTNRLIVGCNNTKIPDNITTIESRAFDGCNGLTSLTIPNSVVSIGFEAFRGCGGLTSIIIPNSVTSIGGYAFRDCSGLTDVTISSSLNNLEEGTFMGCSNLTSIIIPDSVTTIGYRVFHGCSHLTSITIPSSVTQIENAFVECSRLTSIHCQMKEPLLINRYYYTLFFYIDVYASATLYVPKGSREAYMRTNPWDKFKNIVEE